MSSGGFKATRAPQRPAKRKPDDEAEDTEGRRVRRRRLGRAADDRHFSISTSTPNMSSNKHHVEEQKFKQKENVMAPPSLVFQMYMSILNSQHLNHLTLIITVLIIFWRISKASEGFASHDEESSFYRWLFVYVFISTWQILIVFYIGTVTKDIVFSTLQTFGCIVPLCLYFSFFVLNNNSQPVNLLENSHGFSKIFCTINTNDIDCRVEVQQFAPKSIFDCKVRNSSVEWDFCGTLCQSPACLHTSTKKNKFPQLYPN